MSAMSTRSQCEFVQNWHSFVVDAVMITSSLTRRSSRPPGIDAVAEAGERPQDLRPQAHRLDHLDRWSAALPEAAALVEGRVVLDGLERGPDLLGGDGDAHADPPAGAAA